MLRQLGDTAIAVAGIHGVRHTVVRYHPAEVVGTSDMNPIKGDELSIGLREGRKV